MPHPNRNRFEEILLHEKNRKTGVHNSTKYQRGAVGCELTMMVETKTKVRTS